MEGLDGVTVTQAEGLLPYGHLRRLAHTALLWEVWCDLCAGGGVVARKSVEVTYVIACCQCVCLL